MCPRPDRRGVRRAAALVVALAHAATAAAETEYTTVVRTPGGPPQPVSTTVEAEEGRRLPGTGGDPALAAQDLPAVGRPAPGATGLVIGGAQPAETRVLFDGIEIPALYHFGGYRATVGAELVGRIDVVPAAYGAEYGRALGGLVRVEPRALEASDPRLTLDLSLLDAALALRVAGPRGVRVAAAARSSLLDRTYGRYAPPEATALYPIPRYADLQLEAAADVTPRASLRALALESRDRLRRDLERPALGTSPQTEERSLDWWRVGVTYDERGADDRLAGTFYGGADHLTLEQRTGIVPVSYAASSIEAGVRARYRAWLGPAVRLGLGLDALVRRTRLRRVGSLTLPAREGDVTVFGEPPGDAVNTDAWSATVADLGPYVTAVISGGPWTFSPGVRADAFPVDGSRALPPTGATPMIGYARLGFALDPRLAVSRALGTGLVVTAAAGLYHQPVDAGDLSAVFGSPALRPARAAHATLSAWKQLTETASVEATGYYRLLDGLAVRSPLPTPALARALLSEGRGRSYGASVLARRALARGTLAWLSYTISRSERWTPGDPVRPLDFDQTHVLTAVASHRRGGWTVSGRLRYATGMPRTPVTGSFLDLRDGVFQPIFGPQNSARLPAFFQADARVDRLLIERPFAASVSLDVQNVTARRNPEEIVFSSDFASSGYLTGPPLLVLLGLRIEV